MDLHNAQMQMFC